MTKQNYIFIGSPIITKELFRKVLRSLNNYSCKPNGGLWASKYTSPYHISDWYSYLIDKKEIAFYKNLSSASMFTLKDDANILVINDYETVLNLIAKFPSIHQKLSYYESPEIPVEQKIFSFEELTKYYDGVYVDYDHFRFSNSTDIFNSWSVNSLLLFNLDCIESFSPVSIDFDISKFFSTRFYLPHLDIDNIKESKKVEKPSEEHSKLEIITKEMFLERMDDYYNYQFEDYDEYFSTLTGNANLCTQKIIESEKQLLHNIILNLANYNLKISDEIVARNIVLNYLSQYLDSDAKRISSLPKSKVKTPKYYKC